MSYTTRLRTNPTYGQPRRRDTDWGWVAIVGVGILVVGFLIGLAGLHIASGLHEETRTCHVESKDRAYDGTSLQQRVYTDCGVYNVTDAWLAGHHTSADTWASIFRDETYTITTRGYRIGLLSMFPTIIDAQLVENP